MSYINTESDSKNQTIDDFCGMPQGSFEKFLEEQTAENRAMEEKRTARIREALKNRVLKANKPAEEIPDEITQLTKQVFGGARIRISVEGVPNVYMAFSVAKMPECERDWVEILKELVRACEAEEVPDPEIL